MAEATLGTCSQSIKASTTPLGAAKTWSPAPTNLTDIFLHRGIAPPIESIFNVPIDMLQDQEP